MAKKLAQVTVTKILDEVSAPSGHPLAAKGYHQPLYVLSRIVPSGKGVWIGQNPSWQDVYEDHRQQYRPAPQNWLYQMGERFECWLSEGAVTADLVTTNF